MSYKKKNATQTYKNIPATDIRYRNNHCQKDTAIIKEIYWNGCLLLMKYQDATRI